MKLLLIVSLVIAAVFVFDGASILNERRLVNDTAKASAIAALRALNATQDPAKARLAADATATRHHDVITAFVYNPVGQHLTVTVSGAAYTLVIHRLNRAVAGNISASAGR